MEEPGRASVDLRYKITEEDYVEFNQIIFKKETEGKRKRSCVVGMALIILAVILGIQAVVTGRYREYWLDVAVVYSLLCGVYNIVAFRRIYPRSVAKQAKKMYGNTKWARSEVRVEVSETELVYVSEDESFSGKFTDIREVYEGKNIVVVEFHGKQWYLIINKGAMGAELMEKIREYRRGNDKYNKK